MSEARLSGEYRNYSKEVHYAFYRVCLERETSRNIERSKSVLV